MVNNLVKMLFTFQNMSTSSYTFSLNSWLQSDPHNHSV